VARGRRLLGEDIHRRARDLLRGQRAGEGPLVHARPASDVDEVGRGLHAGERRGVDHPAGLVGERRAEHDHVGAAQQAVELVVAEPFVGQRAVGIAGAGQAVAPVGAA